MEHADQSSEVALLGFNWEDGVFIFLIKEKAAENLGGDKDFWGTLESALLVFLNFYANFFEFIAEAINPGRLIAPLADGS